MADTHWHAGHNVSGYLPESDPIYSSEWRGALDAIVWELDSAWDDGTDAQYLDAHTAMHAASEGQDFLTYTATHADSDRDIPTAWWITACTDDGCVPDGY
jgi:hypothetical protein